MSLARGIRHDRMVADHYAGKPGRGPAYRWFAGTGIAQQSARCQVPLLGQYASVWFAGYADVVTADAVWEVKSTKLEPHQIARLAFPQLAVYAWFLRRRVGGIINPHRREIIPMGFAVHDAWMAEIAGSVLRARQTPGV